MVGVGTLPRLHKKLEDVPYREPYNARHSFVSWRFMVDHNVLLVAKED